MTESPFGEAIPPSADSWEVLASTLNRSIMWDLIGPYKIKTMPEKLGINAASNDVLMAEYKDMMVRKQCLYPIRNELSLLSYIAAQVASDTILALDDSMKDMSPEEVLSFRAHNINMGSAIVDAVIGHMIQQGLLHYGGHTS